ncbi:Cyanovirin-N [Lentithecium fluviatile CBS 122367]|uniref:Cyanovirin-N n=1 Tax=Lentithecium fluviatile CBS 122367 TaxID=1168545 RepID=A0A6G1JEI4_9PLEO|nr:Cyanovirin-N [Lentithecium fluviatile CBS 122367]
MKFLSLLQTLLCLTSCTASPTKLPRATASTISSQCTNIRFQGQYGIGWLVGDCLTGSGTERITSGTYLWNKIGNIDGTLAWGSDAYGDTCYECKFLNGGLSLSLNCQCKPHTGTWNNSTLILEEHIAVYSGHILSDLGGPPTVPTIPSPYPFPSDSRYSWGGNSTCAGPYAYWCDGKRFNESCSGGDASSGPLPYCYRTNIINIPVDISAMTLSGGGAWELTAYEDEACTKKIAVLGKEDMDKCRIFSEDWSVKARAVRTRPLFNGDPN